MKRLFQILIILCIPFINQNAQTYKSIFEGNPVWNVYGQGIDFFTTYEYFIKDTIEINDTLYYKVYPINHLIREDSTHSMIFYRMDNTEICIMNLNLNKGDTFTFKTLYWEEEKTIVDSVYYLNDRKIIELSHRYPFLEKEKKLKFIEGIGPTESIHYEFIGFNASLLICYSNDSFLWKNDVDSCSISWVDQIETIKEVSSLQIFPNPVKNSLILINNMEGYVCELFDTQGRIFKHKKLLSNNEKLLITDLKNGLYLIRLIKDNKIITTKILVQK